VSSHTRQWLRIAKFAGWGLVICGVGVPALAIPVSAWLTRTNESSFNQHVGWANIFALTVGAVGVALVVAEKMGAFHTGSIEELTETTEQLAVEVRRQESRALAQLLGTDGLDSRPANFRLSLQGKTTKSKKSSTRTVRPDKIADFFLNESKGRMVLLGAPGSGKTVLAIQLILQLLARRTKEDASVPVLFALASWNPMRLDLEQWLASQLSVRFALGAKVAKRLVHLGLIVPILDGLDEMDPQGEATFRSTRAAECINDFIASTTSCRIVVVSRSGPQYYERVARKVRAIQTVVVRPLAAAQIIDHIRVHCPEEQDLEAWQCVFEGLQGPGSRTVGSVLGTPWRLTAAVTFYMHGGEPTDLLPTNQEKKGHLDTYVERVRTLLMNDFLKARVKIFQRNGPTPTRTIAWLHLIAKRMSTKENQRGQPKEIVLHEWWKLLDEQKVRKWHIFFTFALLHLPFGINGLFGFSNPPDGGRGFFTVAAVMTNYMAIMMISMIRSSRDREPTRLSFRNFKDARILTATGLFATVVCSSIGLITALSYDDPFFGILAGITSASTIILAGASSRPRPGQINTPVEMLQNDRKVALLSGALIGACAGLYYLKIYGISIALIFAEMCLMGRFCCSAYVRYFVATVYGWSRYGLPISLSRFLDWGRFSGILRASGAGYQFRHQELQEHMRSERVAR
jgi:hypothetical protein